MNWLQRKYWHYKLKGSPYQPLFCSPQKGEFVSLDCETTSLDPNRAELVTIAATKIIDNRIITSKPFEVRLRAPQSLDSGSVKNSPYSPPRFGGWHQRKRSAHQATRLYRQSSFSRLPHSLRQKDPRPRLSEAFRLSTT